MARAPLNLKLDPEVRSALENLSKVEGRPINQLLNDAIKSYLRRRSQNQNSLESNARKLKAYRKQDPDYRRAMAAFVEAEASLEDPLEGELIRTKKPRREEPEGPTQRRIREILGD